MDEQTKELIAVGASVGAHCRPCLTYHVTKARELGIEDEHIRAAIDVGHMVETGAMSAMREFTKGTTAATPEKTSACCSGGPSKNGGKCRG